MAREAEISKLVARFANLRSAAQQAVAEHPNDARALFGAAMAFRIGGDFAAAHRLLQRLCELEPGNTHYYFECGATEEYLGKFDAARQSYSKAVQAEPLNYKARHGLVQLIPQTSVQNSIAELEAQFALPDTDGWRRLHLGHALAKAFEDLGDVETSFSWLKRAKEKRGALHPYAPGREERLAAVATASLGVSSSGWESSEPIFVAGLPRSGTTLVDRILSSHADVTSAGEIVNFAQLLKLMSGSPTPATLDADVFGRLAAVDFLKLGRLYIDSTRPLTGRAAHFVDKAPSNYFLAPLILRALPDARVVCMRRHPLDSCLSNYRQIFPFDDRYYDYVYDLESTAHKVVQFERLIERWRGELPADRFLALQYEDLVADQEKHTRALLTFCGLPWDERCLAFQENAAGVSTPSARQVRSAMNSAAVGRWAKYGSLLDPAREVLMAAGVAL